MLEVRGEHHPPVEADHAASKRRDQLRDQNFQVLQPALRLLLLRVRVNLSVLTDRHIDFLKAKRFFNHAVGASFDVYGDQRVDGRGRM
jgi:hypothetical protein